MIYLASPFSHKSGAVEHQRYIQALEAAAALVGRGLLVYSPIVYSYQLHMEGLAGHWEFWRAFDTWFIERVDEVWVLTLDGWEASVGVCAEVKLAKDLGKPVRFVSLEDCKKGNV